MRKGKNIIMKYSTLCLISILLIASCTETIDLQLNTGDNLQLVVDAWIDDSDRRQLIELSLTSDYFNSEAPTTATGATIVMTSSSSGDTYTFSEESPGKYYMNKNLQGNPRDTYNLKINYQTKEYSATHALNRVPELLDIDYIIVADSRINTLSSVQYEIYISFQEPDGKGDYYYVDNYHKYDGDNTNLYQGNYSSDRFYDGEYLDHIFATFGTGNRGDTIVTRLFSISKEAFEYVVDVDNQTEFRGFIFDSPPANVSTNISNGGKGFFIVSAVSEYEKILE
ncbi:MAG: DUF4249 domain-containing protein [Saprospiraceae bacterium]